jgi:COMPASS component BRE2
MAEDRPLSGSTTPLAHPPRIPLDADHAPVVSSPLNPDAAKARASKPPAPAREREQREKKESLKKRENADNKARGGTPDSKAKKHRGPTVPSPMRYIIPEPKASDYEIPKDQLWISHEPMPFFAPGGDAELRKPIDQ